jgi:hypothetical protein
VTPSDLSLARGALQRAEGVDAVVAVVERALSLEGDALALVRDAILRLVPGAEGTKPLMVLLDETYRNGFNDGRDAAAGVANSVAASYWDMPSEKAKRAAAKKAKAVTP